MKRTVFGKGFLLVILLALISAASICAADSVTIIGKIIDDNQIITPEGAVYEIGDTEAGAKLLDTVTDEDQEVSVSGLLHQEGDIVVINVISYKVVAE